MHNHVFHSATYAMKVYAPVAIEAFVLGVDEQAEKHAIYFFIFHWSAVLLEELAYLLAVATVDVGSVIGAWLHDVVKRWRLAKEPQEVNVYSYKEQEQSDKQRAHGIERLLIPGLAGIEALVPCVELLVACHGHLPGAN